MRQEITTPLPPALIIQSPTISQRQVFPQLTGSTLRRIIPAASNGRLPSAKASLELTPATLRSLRAAVSRALLSPALLEAAAAIQSPSTPAAAMARLG